MKRTIEIDDTLQERVETAKEELADSVKEWVAANPGTDWETVYQKHAADAVSEITDSNTPIYYSEINGLYYLYADELEDAYKNAGLGDGSEDNHRQVAIYCYISEKLHEHLSDLEEKHNETK